jgi:hypothetical protein
MYKYVSKLAIYSSFETSLLTTDKLGTKCIRPSPLSS